MKLHSVINLRTVATTLCALGLAAGVAIPAQADQWDKKTILTVDQPVQVEQRLLQPGSYVFRLLDSNSDRHIVQIFNRDQSHLIGTVLAIPNYRLRPTGSSQFLFWETPPGNAKALRAWFYPGDNFGQEFTYPKHLERLEASVTSTTAAAPVQQQAVVQPQPETAVTQPAQPQTETEQPQPQQPVQTAEAAPPPPPPVEEQAPAPAPPPQAPATLPKTATSYPLIGLCGLLSLSFYGLLRLRRSA